MSRILTVDSGLTWFRRILELSLLIGLAYVCSQLFWQIVSPSAPAGHNGGFSQAQQTGLGANSQQVTDRSLLWTMNPFVEQDRSASPALGTASIIDAPETSLNLVLRGVRATPDGRGVAFILLPDNTQVRAEVGTEILDDVRVEHVFGDRITLRTRGELETLFWRKSEDGQSGLLALRAAGDTQPQQAQAGAPRPQRAASRADARQLSSFADLLRGVSLSAVEENGERTGYAVGVRGSAKTLRLAGFEPGDIIREVEGVPVSDLMPEDLEELLFGLQIAAFDIERGTEALHIEVEFSQGTAQ